MVKTTRREKDRRENEKVRMHACVFLCFLLFSGLSCLWWLYIFTIASLSPRHGFYLALRFFPPLKGSRERVSEWNERCISLGFRRWAPENRARGLVRRRGKSAAPSTIFSSLVRGCHLVLPLAAGPRYIFFSFLFLSPVRGKERKRYTVSVDELAHSLDGEKDGRWPWMSSPLLFRPQWTWNELGMNSNELSMNLNELELNYFLPFSLTSLLRFCFNSENQVRKFPHRFFRWRK